MTTAQMKTNREWNAGTSGRDTITIRVTTRWPKMMETAALWCVWYWWRKHQRRATAGKQDTGDEQTYETIKKTKVIPAPCGRMRVYSTAHERGAREYYKILSKDVCSACVRVYACVCHVVNAGTAGKMSFRE